MLNFNQFKYQNSELIKKGNDKDIRLNTSSH